MRPGERARLRQPGADWLHATGNIIVLPVLLGAALAGVACWWAGAAAFAIFAAWGMWVAYARSPSRRPDVGR